MDNVFAFSHGERFLLPDNVPVISKLYDDGVIIGFSNGSVRIYRHADDLFELITHIEYYKPSHKQQLQPLISCIELCNYEKQEWVVVGYTDGTVCVNSLKSGRLLNHTQVPFRPKGIDSGFNYDNLLIWGYACEMMLLDKASLNITVRWTSLRDWPMPVPLFDNRILVIYKDGETEQYRIKPGSSKPIKIEQSLELSLFSQPKSSDGHFHNVDLVVALKRVGPVSWLVVQRSGWTLYKWEEEQLVNQISSGSAETLTDVVCAPGSTEQECFGVLGRDGSVVWVHDANVQLIEPIWDGQASQIMYSPKTAKLIAMVLTDVVKFYVADTSKSPIAWQESKMIEKFNYEPKTVSAIHENDVVIAKGPELAVYKLAQFISEFESMPPTLHIKGDEFTVIKSTMEKSNIVAGTRSGTLICVDKSVQKVMQSVQLFASPVERLMSIPADGRASSDSLKGCMVATSNNSTICVVDLLTGAKKCTIPGNNVTISHLELVSVQEQPCLTVKYENGELRTWNLHTGDEVPEADEGFRLEEEEYSGYLIPISSDTRTKPAHPVVLIRMDRFINSLSTYLESDRTLDDDRMDLVRAVLSGLIPIPEESATKTWQQQLSGSNVRVGQVFWNASFLSISEIADPDRGAMQDPDTYAYVVSVWIMLVRLLLKSQNQHVESTGRLLNWLMETTSNSFDLSGFAALASTSPSTHIRNSARSCLKELVRAADTDHTAVIQQWERHLPSKVTDLYSDRSLQALEISASLVITQYKRAHKAKELTLLAREVAESLQLYLTEEAPEEHRDAAIEFIGKGWSIWQKHFNPLGVLDALIQVLYHQGYTQSGKQNPRDTRKASLMLLCQRCVLDIATQNITLLISALVTHLGSNEQPLDARVTSIRLLSNLVSSSHQYIHPEHLPTIISAIVKTLDPSDASLRETAPIGGTSIISESTQFLSAAMARHADYLAFHKAQQRLAVSTLSGASLLGLVYDLRTGTVVASLAVQQSDSISASSVLKQLQFSPDGKQIAGVISSDDTSIDHVAVWKLGLGFMSLLHSFSSVNQEAESATTYPALTKAKNFKWMEDNTLKSE